ncbi:MAG: tetratricopeptide repeat protein [Streptosporangiaceae bacterium]|nr:tetratricopeptide repeat protein [Streptosporangiaceae bacterium]
MTDLPADASPRGHHGQIVTFYSYKGGTGRTMALANVAWILAANGHRVLVADWDLESPGLDRFFQPFLGGREVRHEPGIIDMIRDYERVAKKTEPARRSEIIGDLSRVQRYAFSLDWEFPDGGSLDFLSPGKQNRDYVATLSALDWDSFYESLSGGEFLDALREDMRDNYDYVLIDSRTGLSDIADICTLHLPDVLVDCFTLSTQGIEGAAKVAQLVRQRQLHGNRVIRVLPVPMRIDRAEKEKADTGRLVAMRHFVGLPEGLADAVRREYWASTEVPYQAFYAYEETLAVFGDPPGVPSTLLASFERLTAYITSGTVTSLPPMDEQLRERTMAKFTRGAPLSGERIVVESLAEDQVWAEWIAAVLSDAGIDVSLQRLGADGGTPGAGDGLGQLRNSRTLIVVSAAYLARRHRLTLPTETLDLAVYVSQSTSAPLSELAAATPVFLAGLPQGEATERLRRLFGLSGRPSAEIPAVAGTSFPGVEPKIFTAPARNVQFTGREDDLGTLRDMLRAPGAGRVAVGGLGGVGKTQVSLEYVHRFKTDYDVVWWIDCGDPAFVDAALADLGVQLRNVFGMNVLASADSGVVASQVLDLLGQGGPRWLLIYDNADEVEAIAPFLPKGGGHVLITSRSRAWTERGASQLLVDVFSREESVAHLRQRVPAIDRAEAAKIAAAVGYLPLAVATAGAWLATTSYTVTDYLQELERQPQRVLSESELPGQVPISQVWNVSLNRLAQSSPAAARLFELCSVMASRISLGLLYSAEVSRVLEPLDPALSETMVIARVVQEINRLALIKHDAAAREIIVHLLVQEVVRSRMSADQLAVAREAVHGVLVAGRPGTDVDDPGTWDGYRLIWPHLAPSQAASSSVEAVRQLFIDRVRYLWLRGDLDRGARLAEETDACWTELEAAADSAASRVLRRQILQLRFNLGNILRSQGRYAQARELNTATLAEQTQLLGQDHPHTLMTAGSLAGDLRAVGQYREALEMDQRTYPAWTALYGDDHPRTLLAANNLAVTLRLTGDITAALRVDSDTYERRRTVLGPRNPQTLASARNIARDLLEAGEYPEALARIEETHRTTAEVLGTDSPDALDMQVLLGITLRSAGRLAEADTMFHTALGMLTRRFGGSSGEVLACRLSNAANLLTMDRFEEATADIRQVLAAYSQRLGPLHPHTLVCQVDLAAVLRVTQAGEAITAIQEAITGLAAVLGDAHPYTLAAQMSHSTLLADQGHLEQAERLCVRTLEALVRILGSGHPDTLRCRVNLELTREQLGDHSASERRAAAIDQLARLLGDGHPTIGTLSSGRKLVRALDPQPF